MNISDLIKCAETIKHDRSINTNILKSAFTAPTVAAILAISASFMSPSALAISNGLSTSKAWVVQTTMMGGPTGSCTGSAITRNAILTAASCGQPNEVYYPDGTRVHVNDHIPLSENLQILFLSQDHVLSEYAKLGPDYLDMERPIPNGSAGEVYGYGMEYHYSQKRLNVSVDGHGLGSAKDPRESIYTQPLTGRPENGDTGGPLIIGGHVVGVVGGSTRLSNGSTADVFHGISREITAIKSAVRYMDHARELRSADDNPTFLPWIADVKLENGAVAVTMGSELINAGREVVVWVNGRYLGQVNNGGSYYYATKQDIKGGAIFRMGGFKVSDNDLIQIGIINGAFNPQSSELLYHGTLGNLNGADSGQVEGTIVAPSGPSGSSVGIIAVPAPSQGSVRPGNSGSSVSIIAVPAPSQGTISAPSGTSGSSVGIIAVPAPSQGSVRPGNSGSSVSIIAVPAPSQGTISAPSGTAGSSVGIIAVPAPSQGSVRPGNSGSSVSIIAVPAPSQGTISVPSGTAGSSVGIIAVPAPSQGSVRPGNSGSSVSIIAVPAPSQGTISVPSGTAGSSVGIIAVPAPSQGSVRPGNSGSSVSIIAVPAPSQGTISAPSGTAGSSGWINAVPAQTAQGATSAPTGPTR